MQVWRNVSRVWVVVAFSLVAALVSLGGVAEAEVVEPTEPGQLSVRSPFPPWVIVKAGETYELTATGLYCGFNYEVPQIRVASVDPDTFEPNGFVDLVIEDFAVGEPFDRVLEPQLSIDAVQGTYRLVATCEEQATLFEEVGEEVQVEGVAVGTEAQGTDGGSGAEVQSAGLGWIVVGDENRMPPSWGTFEMADDQVEWDVPVEVIADGFIPDSETEVWLYSDPILLGSATASATGAVVSEVVIPFGTAAGAHTMVIAGRNAQGRPIFLTAGVTVGAATGEVSAPGTTPLASTATGASTGATTGTASTQTTAQTTAQTGATLPATGAGSGRLAALALVLMATGAFALFGGRRVPVVARKP